MNKKLLRQFAVATLAGAALTLSPSAFAGVVGPSLQTRLGQVAAGEKVRVIVTFNNVIDGGLTEAHLNVLRTLPGAPILGGTKLTRLGMAIVNANAAQVALIAASPAVRSVWLDEPKKLALHQARILTGVEKLRTDASFTALNGGLPVDGRGVVNGSRPLPTVVINDSGIDTTHPDLFLVNATTNPDGKVIRNVQLLNEEANGTSYNALYYADVPSNDTVGHGSHCAGIVGGAGTFSKTTADPQNGSTFEDYSGAASGVKLIGTGSGAGLFILYSLGGYEFALQFKDTYNIRVISNSFGSAGAYDPNSPDHAGIQALHDNGIAVVFAAGNSGPGVDTIGAQAKDPAVICVAAGTKEGGVASFSSRGVPASERTGLNVANVPAITAPGTGREFESSYTASPTGRKLTAAIISTKSLTATEAQGLTDDAELPAIYAAKYTQISGTSMACPFIAGVCALMLDANPALQPDDLKAILQATATNLPEFDDYAKGAGYVNAFAAVDAAFKGTKNPGQPFVFPAKGYGPLQQTSFNAVVTATALAPLPNGPFMFSYSPNRTGANDYPTALAASQTYPASNAYNFTVSASPDAMQKVSVLDVRIQFGNSAAASQGNALGLKLWAPDGTVYSSGPALPVLDSPTRQVVVKNPVPGVWVAEAAGVRGLAAVPVTPPTGAGVPDTVNGQIYRTNLFAPEPPDVSDSPRRAAIIAAVTNRYMDVQSNGFFGPKTRVTRAELAQALATNTTLRQTLADAPPFTDVIDPKLQRIAQAVAARGSTLRQFDFSEPAALPSSGATQFRPTFFITRTDAAVALVRSIGQEPLAQSLANTTVTVKDNAGNPVPLADIEETNPNLRGHLQIALDRGLLDYTLGQINSGGTVTTVGYARPSKQMQREELAQSLVKYHAAFQVGN